jgi:hypothetical protein
VITIKKNNGSAYNTDNAKGKLFVTFFAFVPAIKTGKYRLINPDRATASNMLNCTWINE